MTWETMLAMIRVRLNDPNGRIWSSAELLKYANEIQRDLTILAEAKLKRVAFSLVDGTRTYSLPGDCYEVRGVKLNGRKLFGRTTNQLEELSQSYMSDTGQPYHYYMEDVETIAFYPVPTWTDDTDAFDSELGVWVEWTEDSTDATFNSDLGVAIEAIDTTQQKHFIFDSMMGVVAQENNAGFVAEVTYIFNPKDLVNLADTPAFPTWVQDGQMFGVLEQALSREGKGKDATLAKYFGDRFTSVREKWFYRNREFARGKDQMLSQRPVSWTDDLDYRLRTNP